MTITPGTDFIKLTLSFHQRQVLQLIADRGGRLDFQFGASSVKVGNTFTEAEKADIVRGSDQSIRDMADKLGLITITPIIGYTETFHLALTDIGRNVTHQMKLVVERQEQTIQLRKPKA